MSWLDAEEVEVEFDAVKASTDKAVLILVDGEEYWIPKSQIGDLYENEGRFATGGSLTIPEWLAEEKGLA